MSGYYCAEALVELRTELNVAFPHRDHASDGWIGDASHAARKSDHNPDYSDGGIVRAFDIDNDGIPVDALVALLIKDPRTNYVIWNRHIWSREHGFVKRVYTGASPHTEHVHLSILHDKAHEHSRGGWNIQSLLHKPAAPKPAAKPKPPAHSPIQTVAREVIDGKWGNGDARTRKLRAAGYDPVVVQREVNRQLGKR